MSQNPSVLVGWLSCLMLSLWAPSALAQRTLSYTEPDYHYRTGIELFEKSNYAAARHEFQQYLNRRNAGPGRTLPSSSDPNAVEAEYYVALASLYSDEPGAEVLVDRFVNDHGEHPRAGQLYGDLGAYYYNKADYERAIGFLEKAVERPGGGRVADTKYQLAMAYYNTRNFDKALPLLDELKQNTSLPMAPAAAYYAGVIQYGRGNYDAAVADFRRIERDPTYQNEVPNFIVQALYRQRRYSDLLAYTEPLLRRSAGNKALADVALFTAEVYYRQNQYANAVPYYRQYVAARPGQVPATVRFRYGQSLFRTGAQAEAITQLKPLAAGQDTTAQYAAYTLGISYMQTQNPAGAITAFDQAARLPFNPALQEEALFTRAKLQLDQNNGADAVRELTQFLQRYPASRYADEANELLSEAYLASNNYPAAIRYIEGLQRRTPKINATYQRLTFNQGISEYNAERYAPAIANLDKSLQTPGDAELKTNALFWKAEALSALRQYDQAIPVYAQVRTGEAAVRSQYGLAYAYYNKKEYGRALPLFQAFARNEAANKVLADDALVRAGDCLLATKQYAEALRYYDQAIARNSADRDYAGYQKGVVLSYLGRDADAKTQFEQVQRQFPTSRYAENALLQGANVDFEKGNYPAAIQGYGRFIQSRPQSPLLATALLKRAVAYGNLQQYDAAAADYRRILSEFGNSADAQSALLGLQNTLADAGRPEEFGQELTRYKQRNPGRTDVEKVEFENAKSLYFNEKYQQAAAALIQYTREYPNSPATPEAQFYLAESYARLGDATSALQYYGRVVQEGRSAFVGRAASRAGELERQQKNYPRAVRNYQTALAQASAKPEEVAALLGLMDTYLAIPKPDSAAYAAQRVLAAGNVVPGAQNRAQLALGKAALAKGDYKTAQTEFERTMALAKDAAGAEANYLIGELLFSQKRYRESIAALLKFNEQFDGFESWKGRAFLLVADNNVALNEPAQARAVLNSIIDNATDPAIVAEARQKLAALDAKK